MKINVKVHTKSKQEKIEKTGDFDYDVWMNVPPEKGKANKKLVEMLAEHFEVSLSQVFIVSGAHSKNKKVEIVE